MHLAALPASEVTSGNRYNTLLTSALQQLGVTVEEWTPRVRARGDIDIVHVHWPEIPINIARPTHAAVRTMQFLAGLRTVRARGARVVWTAHNLRSHQQRRPHAERGFWAAMDGLIDGWIALTEASVEPVLEAHPRLRGVPHVVVPHGHYRSAYADTVSREEARAALGLRPEQRVATFIGRIRPYKGVDRLVETFAELDDDDACLLIAGRCDDIGTAGRLTAAAARDHRLRLHLGPIPDDDLQLWLRGADLAVLPYTDVLNSGSALLALSFDVPLLTPAVGGLVELSRAVPGWVQHYEGEVTPTDLRRQLERPRPSGRPDLHAFDWEPIARKTLEFYEQIASRGREQRRSAVG